MSSVAWYHDVHLSPIVQRKVCCYISACQCEESCSHGMAIMKLQKHISCKPNSRTAFRVYGKPMAASWLHTFAPPIDVAQLRRVILKTEQFFNTNVVIRLFARPSGTWKQLVESDALTLDRHFVPYNVCMRSGYTGTTDPPQNM